MRLNKVSELIHNSTNHQNLSTDVVVDGLPLMFNMDGEACFLFYWKSDPTRFKSFDEDLLTLIERVDKVILE